MKDVSYLGPISEGMHVLTADGQILGVVRTVWGGFADLHSALEMEKETGVGAAIDSDPEISALPEGTTPVGETMPGYLEVEGVEDGRPLYIPLTDLADVMGEQVVLHRTFEDATSGMYADDPSSR